MWELLALTLLGGATVWYNTVAGRKRLRTWQDAAVSCGLQVVKTSSFWPKLEARTERVEVRIETGGDKGRLTEIGIKGPRPPDFHMVKIRREPLFQWAREIEVGDDFFDQTFFIEGPMRLVLALLDAETRRLLLRVNDEGRPELSLDGLRVSLRDEKVSSVLPLLLGIGERFAQPMDIPRRLAENAQQDPKDGVRLQNLLFLIRHYPKAPQTAEALRTACSDSRPEIRLRAAKALGAEGKGVLLALAENLENDAVSAEAVSLLDQELPYERVVAIFDRARGGLTALACLEIIGRSGAPGVAGKLVKVMEEEKGELAAAAARALGEIGDPATEPWLISALRREEPAIRLAAASALGRVGSVAAVLPLKEAAESSWLDVDLHRVTRQAIAEIQSRIPGASPGQLSIAGAEAGQLSLVEAEAGRLSIATDQEGQLSISDEGKPKDV